jgi:hypothetical protein
VTQQPTRSLRRLYLEWVEEEVERFKEQVPRSELLALADQVVEELRVNPRGQYQITEMLLCDAVDRKIFRLLKLPSYRSWSENYRRMPEEPAMRSAVAAAREAEREERALEAAVAV